MSHPRRLCRHTRNPAFLGPTTSTDLQVRAALRMCGACPALVECAAEALESGTTPDGDTVAPATDVLQAGVICDGSRQTVTHLARVAGVPLPTYGRKIHPREWAGDHCRECDRRMFKWTRGVVPEGYVMHRGRGICVKCRVAYRAELEATGPLRRTRRRTPLERVMIERLDKERAREVREGGSDGHLTAATCV